MKTFSLTALTILASIAIGFAEGGKTPTTGDTAPLIQGKNQDGKTWKLSDDLGKKVVLLYCLA